MWLSFLLLFIKLVNKLNGVVIVLVIKLLRVLRIIELKLNVGLFKFFDIFSFKLIMFWLFFRSVMVSFNGRFRV